MPNEPKPFSVKERLKSFVYAGEGIIRFFRTEHNAQIHLAATALVIILAFVVKVSKTETVAIIFAIASVWITEMLNTAIEKAMDFISLERHPEIKRVKDLAAGAVLVAAMAAIIVGCMVFIPKFFTW
jgi:diacylglycerol kinase (ATP)